ncbi:MAG TPA: nucleotidyltransferase family protein [Planctomycetaceae bacterium]|jgi:molybdenum cofactor cytidylyltransferase|nr:nucleotidyltransferase family protein [Planctomycetaceae bacterium]
MTTSTSFSGFPFALIPAAGRSRRMGTPKLLLDVGGQTVLARLLAGLENAGVSSRWVVVHPDDAEIRAEVERHGGRALVPDAPPPDMRASVAYGLTVLRERFDDCGVVPPLDAPWLLVPADHPVLSAEIVTALLEAARVNPGRIFIPTYRGRSGHPTVFAWRHALEVDQIPPEMGLNWIVRQHAADVVHVPVENEGVVLDLDTPEDYERVKGIWRT